MEIAWVPKVSPQLRSFLVSSPKLFPVQNESVMLMLHGQSVQVAAGSPSIILSLLNIGLYFQMCAASLQSGCVLLLVLQITAIKENNHHPWAMWILPLVSLFWINTVVAEHWKCRYKSLEALWKYSDKNKRLWSKDQSNCCHIEFKIFKIYLMNI